MSVPSRVEAAVLLLSLAPPPWHLRHSRAVAEVAGWLAARAQLRGVPVDRGLVEAAALLHDVDKILPAGDAARLLPHGAGSAAWLAARGHRELADAVVGHPVTRLADGIIAEPWLEDASIEARLVAYADKRAGQRLESMASRFDEWGRRHPVEVEARMGRAGWDAATVAAVRARADRLERDACLITGVLPAAVGRLRWTGPALALARRRLRAIAAETRNDRPLGIDAGGTAAGSSASEATDGAAGPRTRR